MANIVKHMRTKRFGATGLSPSPTLSDAAQAIFQHIVSNVDESHFNEVDRPLLESYCNAAALGTQAAQRLDTEGAVGADGKVSPWLAVSEKCGKVLVAVSARLRICPQSRFDRLVGGSNSRPQLAGKKPWEFDLDDDPLLT
jgi:phage terminase small subunit